ncbi:thioredoxin family protein [Sunxiuqinia sp. A32]|uniref:thioredoxin family protein n=1 Tax=Sunxiuqinia sp. A32 TaxID=3461496 RepID=UPI00404670C6
MKTALLLVTLLIGSICLSAQPAKIYNPDADAKTDIQNSIKKAQKENKHIFLQIGGNWCSWCIKFHRFVDSNQEIKSFVDDNFVVIKVNYSGENKNEEILKELDFPQRFGFPVFVVLDKNGNRIHTQNSAYLEADGGYSPKEVLIFYKQWSPKALDPATYEK